jgi:DNA-directed RNA polymerase subunit RPC12/RpoP
MELLNKIKQKILSIIWKLKGKPYFCLSCGWRGKLKEKHMGNCPNCWHNGLVADTPEWRELDDNWKLQLKFYNLIRTPKNLLLLIRRNYSPN